MRTNPDELVLTPGGDAYRDGLSLHRTASGHTIAAWARRTRAEEAVCWRSVDGSALGPIVGLQPVKGSPCSPKVAGKELLWLEFADAKGTLVHATIDAVGVSAGEPSRVAPLDGLNIGDFACAEDEPGQFWLLAESWKPASVDLHLLRFAEGRWDDRGVVNRGEGFRARPRIAVGAGGVLGSWDEFDGDCYRVMTCPLGEERVEPTVLPAPEHDWESLSAAACAGDGTWYAARCRETLVELEDGIAGRHSRLVVAARSPSGETWLDVAEVDIDHALNPWMAAYVGHRRFPFIIPEQTGIHLLWEEKLDATSMSPNLGRLCALPIGCEGAMGEPMVAVDERCMFVPEAGLRPLDEDSSHARLLVASKTQWDRYDQRLPWHLHEVDLGAMSRPRPADTESNAKAPPFRVGTPLRTRPEMELDGRSLKLYFGDPHLHSRMSQDLDGEQDELYLFAQRIAALDFAAFAENDFHWFVEPLSEAEWQRNRRNAEWFNDPGRFTALLGWEFTKHSHRDDKPQLHSHRSVILPGGDGEVICHHESDTPTPAHLARRLQGQRVLLHHHHPNPLDITDDSLERNVEICSGWWNCMLHDRYAPRLHEVLREGKRIGFIGGSDNHERNPGLGGALTGVWAEENTREAIFEALWQRRVFATTGFRTELQFRVAGAFMGSETTTSAPPVLELLVSGEEGIDFVEFLRDGELVERRPIGEAEARVSWSDEACPPGEHSYYAHVRYVGEDPQRYWNAAPAYGPHAWSSPVWVVRKD